MATMTTTIYNQQQQTITMSNGNFLKKSELTNLVKALYEEDFNGVNTILTKRQIGKERSRIGRTALHYIAENGNTDCLELLTSLGDFDLNAFDHEGHTGLHLAVINGNRDCVQILINAKANINCLDHEKHSLVHWATVCGESEILSLLLLNGANASTIDIHNATPLHYAAQMCGSIKNTGGQLSSPNTADSARFNVSKSRSLIILRQLIQHGVNVRVKDQDGREPLLWAASAGSSEAILALVNAGASVDAEDKDGLTALHCAASRGHTDCIETLIGLCGCNVDIIDNNGCTALFYAVTLGHPDCTELLLNYGSEPNRQDRKGRTPAHCASSKGQLETIKQIHNHGANLWMRNVRGELPLHEAILSRRKELVQWLLSQRPDTVNATNNDGRTCLHLAALSNNVQMVKILLDHSADVNSVMRNGKGTCMTPLDAALYRGNSAVAKFLQVHGGVAFNSLNDPKFMNRVLLSQNRSTLDSRLSNNMTNNSRLSFNNMTNIQCNTPDNHVVLTPDYIISSTPIQQYYQQDGNDAAAKKLMMLMENETPIPGENANVQMNRSEESEGFQIDSSDDPNITEIEREVNQQDEGVASAEEEILEQQHLITQQQFAEEQQILEQQQVLQQQQMAQEQQLRIVKQLREEEIQTDEQDMNEAYVEIINRKTVVKFLTHESSQTEYGAEYGRRQSTDARRKSYVEQKDSQSTTTSSEDKTGTSNDLEDSREADDNRERKISGTDETEQTEDDKAGVTQDTTNDETDQHEGEEHDDNEGNEEEEEETNQEGTTTNDEEDTDATTKFVGKKDEETEDQTEEQTDDTEAEQELTVRRKEESEEEESEPELEREPEVGGEEEEPSQSEVTAEEGPSRLEPDELERSLIESARRTRYHKNKNIKSAHHNKANGKNSKRIRKARSIESKTVSRSTREEEYVKRERRVTQARSTSPIERKREKRDKKGTKSVSPTLMMNCDDGYMSSRSVSLDLGSNASSVHGSLPGSDDEGEKGEGGKASKKSRPSSKKSEAEAKSRRSSRKSEDGGSKSRAGSRKREEVNDDHDEENDVLEKEMPVKTPRPNLTRNGVSFDETGGRGRSDYRSSKSRSLSRKSTRGDNDSRPPSSTKTADTDGRSSKHRPESAKTIDIDIKIRGVKAANFNGEDASSKGHQGSSDGSFGEDTHADEGLRSSSKSKMSNTSKAPSRMSQPSNYSDTQASDQNMSESQSSKSIPKRTKIPKSNMRKSNMKGGSTGTPSGTGSDSNHNSGTDEIDYGSKLDLQSAVKNRKLKPRAKPTPIVPSTTRRTSFRADGKIALARNARNARNKGNKQSGGSQSEHPNTSPNTSEEREIQIQNKIMSGKKQSILYEMSRVDKLDKQIYSRSTSRMNESGHLAYGRVNEGKGTDIETPVSVTQAMQVSMRKYALERHIFSQLLELKRLDCENNNRTQEQIIVKRLVEANRRAGLHHHFRDFDANFTFRNYEKYLYDQLKVLQSGNKKLIPRFAPSDDIEKLTQALKTFNKTTFPYIHNVAEDNNARECCHTTHKCHHAAHAYTGVPCAAYIPNPTKYGIKRGNQPLSQVSRLPRVNPAKAPGPIQKSGGNSSDGSAKGNSKIPKENNDVPTAPSPITLHLQQGEKKAVFQLPSDTELDPSKNYYVSLSIKPSHQQQRRNSNGNSDDGNNLNQSI